MLGSGERRTSGAERAQAWGGATARPGAGEAPSQVEERGKKDRESVPRETEMRQRVRTHRGSFAGKTGRGNSGPSAERQQRRAAPGLAKVATDPR